MATLDLDRDITINGNTFKAGEKVNTTVDVTDENGKTSKVDYADAIQEQLKAAQEADDFASKHHGAVPTSDNPNEATAQTPTRPLGAENVAVEAQAVSGVEESNKHEVKDPDGKSANGKK